MTPSASAPLTLKHPVRGPQTGWATGERGAYGTGARRLVDDGMIVTAEALTSGIDAALHVVACMVGEAAAERTAEYMEYESDGWRTGKGTRAQTSPLSEGFDD